MIPIFSFFGKGVYILAVVSGKISRETLEKAEASIRGGGGGGGWVAARPPTNENIGGGANISFAHLPIILTT